MGKKRKKTIEFNEIGETKNEVIEDNPLSKKVKELYDDRFNDNMNVLRDSELVNTQILF